MNYDETSEERFARLEAEFKSRPDAQRRQLEHDLQYGKRPLTPADLAASRQPVPPLSDEDEFAIGQNRRDWAELERIYGDLWPELRQRVVSYFNSQSEEWKNAQFADFGRIGQVKVFQRIISQLRQGR